MKKLRSKYFIDTDFFMLRSIIIIKKRVFVFVAFFMHSFFHYADRYNMPLAINFLYCSNYDNVLRKPVVTFEKVLLCSENSLERFFSVKISYAAHIPVILLEKSLHS